MSSIADFAELFVTRMEAENALREPEDWNALKDALFAALNEAVSDKYALKKETELEQLCANSVTLEVSDAETGVCCRRTLPLEYIENDNGIQLAGENYSGERSEIVFLSEKGMSRMLELMGKGADKPRCKD